MTLIWAIRLSQVCLYYSIISSKSQANLDMDEDTLLLPNGHPDSHSWALFNAVCRRPKVIRATLFILLSIFDLLEGL